MVSKSLIRSFCATVHFIGNAIAQLFKLFWLYKIFDWFKPVECTECQKNRWEVELFWIVLKVVLISMQITYPFAYFPSNWNILAFLTTFQLSSFHLILFLWTLNSFMRIYAFKRKKKSGKLCVYNHGDKYVFRFTCTCMQIPLHFSAYFTGDKNVTFDFSDACLFGHPVYFDCQDYEGKSWENNAITEQSHATRFKTAELDISGILCSTVASKTIKCFTKLHLLNNRRHLSDRKICIY